MIKKKNEQKPKTLSVYISCSSLNLVQSIGNLDNHASDTEREHLLFTISLFTRVFMNEINKQYCRQLLFNYYFGSIILIHLI